MPACARYSSHSGHNGNLIQRIFANPLDNRAATADNEDMTRTEDTRGEDRKAWKSSYRYSLSNTEQPNLPIEAYDFAADEVRDLTAEEMDIDRPTQKTVVQIFGVVENGNMVIKSRIIAMVSDKYTVLAEEPFPFERKMCSNKIAKAMKGMRY